MNMADSGLWPVDELDVINRCPVCGGAEREQMYDGLEDKSFGAAPGRWTLHRCGQCHAAYLDPRPSEASIWKAYSNYYTHGGADPKKLPSRRRGLNAAMKNGYLNAAYGYTFPHAVPGYLATALFDQRSRTKEDYFIRHLTAPAGEGARLLDVGCGNGAFLAVAQDLGFQAVGLEPDPAAVEVGRQSGLDIHQGLLPNPAFQAGTFDHVMFSHVLEHLHHPVEALAQTFKMLRPGGRIWLCQPNLGALGLTRFGSDWRGLETPRHLTLFTAPDLIRLLQQAGFVRVSLMRPDRVASFYYRQSAAMQAGIDPQEPGDPPGWQTFRREARAADDAAQTDPSLGEALTLTGFKPAS